MAMDLGTAIAYIDLDMTAFNQGINSVNTAIQSFQTGIEQGSLSLTGFLNSAGAVATNVGAGFTKGVTAPILTFGKSAIQAGMDFDEAMSKVKAITQATDDDFEKLRDLAIKMGAETKFSATESAEAMTYMGMAGWNAQQIMDGLAGVMYLAAASGEDLGSVSDIVTDSLTAFGMTAEESSDYANLLAQAARKSNTDVSKMGQTFKYVAPVAGTFGMTSNDVAFAIGLMANNGVKASQAGTSLRGAITRLMAPTEQAEAMMLKLGLATEQTIDIMDEGLLQEAQEKVAEKTRNMEQAQLAYNEAVAQYGKDSLQAQDAAATLEGAQLNLAAAMRDLENVQTGNILATSVHNDLMVDESGNARDLYDVLVILRETFRGLSDEEQAQAANLLFGKTAMSGMLAIINSSDDIFNQLSDDLRNTTSETNGLNNAAEEMSETMLDNLAGSITIFQSNLESLKIKLNDMVSGPLKALVEKMTELVQWFISLDEETTNQVIQWALFAAAIGPVLLVAGKLMTSVSGIITGFQTLMGVFGAVGNSLLRLKEAMAIAKEGSTWLASSVSNLYKIFFDFGFGNSAPIALVVAGIALLVAGFVKAFSESERFREAVGNLFEQIKRFFGFVMEIVQSVWGVVQPVLDLLIDLIAKIWEWALPPIVTIIEAIMDVIEALMPIITIVIDTIGMVVEILVSVLGPVLEGIIAVIGALIDIISLVIDWIAKFIKWILEPVKEIGEQWKKLKKGIGEAGDWIRDKFSDLFGWLFDGVDWVREKVEGLFDWLPWNSKKAAKDTADGFKEGIDGNKSKALDSVKMFGDDVSSTFAKSLDINSPSGVFKDFGENTLVGFEKGVEKKAPGVQANMFMMGDGIFSSFKNGSAGAIQKLPQIIANVLQGVYSVFSTSGTVLSSIGANLFGGFFNSIQSVWGNISSWVSNAVSGLVGTVNSFIGKIRTAGSHANGLDYVPYDGYIAQLHKGERVLTKAENKEYGSGNSGSGGDTFNFYNTQPDPYTYARQMKRVKRELALG